MVGSFHVRAFALAFQWRTVISQVVPTTAPCVWLRFETNSSVLNEMTWGVFKKSCFVDMFLTFFPLVTSPVSPFVSFLLPGSAFSEAGSSPLRRSRVTSSCSSCTCFCSSTTSPPVLIPESFDTERLRRGPVEEEPVLSRSSKMESWRITAAWGHGQLVRRDDSRIVRWAECWSRTCRACSWLLRLTNRWQTSCKIDTISSRCFLISSDSQLEDVEQARCDPSLGLTVGRSLDLTYLVEQLLLELVTVPILRVKQKEKCFEFQAKRRSWPWGPEVQQ